MVIPAAIAILAYSCSLTAQQPPSTVLPNFNELVLLTDSPCTAPCWQGLEIGVSTRSEVIATISTLKFIDQKTVRVIPQSVPDLNPENWVQGENIIATCINRWGPCLRLTIANAKLRDIDIELDRGMTLDDVINHFGKPDYVGSHTRGGDVIDCRVELVWLKQQLILYSTFFTEPEDINDGCYAVDENGTPSGNLEIAEARYLPLEDISMRTENNQLTDFVGTK
jgi:hypothetical protein